MTGPSPAVAAVRRAVRAALRELPPGTLVLVAGSGGPDSSALVSAAGWVCRELGVRAGFACVDHGWSPASAAIADRARTFAAGCGLVPARVLAGPPTRTEGEAREVRRSLLTAYAEQVGAEAVLLAHTLDDQAETVLLGLARGSGARSLSGMAPRSGLWWRPLLGLRREVLRAYCAEQDVPVWEDPSNADPRHARSRVRHDALPALEAALGPGVAEALARTAELLRADADALDALADAADEAATRLEVAALARLAPAVRTRLLRRAALAAGSPPSDLSAGHVAALDALTTAWHGQGPLHLPGPVKAARRDGRIVLTPAPPERDRTKRGPLR